MALSIKLALRRLFNLDALLLGRASSSSHRCFLLAQRRRVAVLVVSGVQLRTRPMGSRSDAIAVPAGAINT